MNILLPFFVLPCCFVNTTLFLEILDFYALLHSHLRIHLQFCLHKIKSYDNLRCLQCLLKTPVLSFFSVPCNSYSYTDSVRTIYWSLRGVSRTCVSGKLLEVHANLIEVLKIQSNQIMLQRVSPFLTLSLVNSK